MMIGNFERYVTSISPPQRKVIHVAAAFYRECGNDNQCRRHGAWNATRSITRGETIKRGNAPSRCKSMQTFIRIATIGRLSDTGHCPLCIFYTDITSLQRNDRSLYEYYYVTDGHI